MWDDPERGTLLLDGRNRARACELAGVTTRTQRYTGDDPIGFSVAQNVRRRHLSDGQKAAVADAALALYEDEARKRQAQAGSDYGKGHPKEPQKELGADRHQAIPEQPAASDEVEPIEEEKPQQQPPKRAPRAADQAAKTAGTSGRSVARFKRVKHAAPDLAEKVRAGTLALDRAERIIRAREAEQRRVKQT